jgi:hypothetical protein
MSVRIARKQQRKKDAPVDHRPLRTGSLTLGCQLSYISIVPEI